MRWLMGIGVAAAVLAAPAVAQNPAPAMVAFRSGVDTVAPAGRASLDAFVRRYKAGNQVTIAGHATLEEAKAAIKADGGSKSEQEQSAAGFAVGLSQRRANNVRSYLATRGIPSGVMTTQAFGASRPDGVDGRPATRGRVEVSEGPTSGW